MLRNRLQHIELHNLKRVGAALDELARRVGFRVIPGLGERVIYRELFPKGLTLLDLQQLGEVGIGHITARQELREMVAGLGIPDPGESNRRASPQPSSELISEPKPKVERGSPAWFAEPFSGLLRYARNDRSAMTHNFNPTILREYDIRGIVGDTLTEDDAYALGRTYGAIAHDEGARRSPSAATAAPIRACSKPR